MMSSGVTKKVICNSYNSSCTASEEEIWYLMYGDHETSTLVVGMYMSNKIWKICCKIGSDVKKKLL